MQPSIFGKILDDVEFFDVVTFCTSQPKESLGLDYKKDLSSLEKVVKTLVSFANTNGGWVIVGIEDDGNDMPKLPVTGMSFSNDLEQKITNSIISSVSPIVLPYYKVCVSPDGKKAFLVAYMPQSSTAPHWMLYKGKYQLFVRHSDRAAGDDWENTATPNQWEMLHNRRQISINLRDQLAARMKEVFEARASDLIEAKEEQEREEQRKNSPFGLSAVLPMTTYFGGEEYEGAQVISLLPTYPTIQIADVPAIEQQIEHEAVRTGYTDVHPQTPDHQSDPKIYQNGVYAFNQERRTGNPYFFGVDVFGNMINVDPLEITRVRSNDAGEDEVEYVVTADRLVGQIINALKFAEKTYAHFGLLGNLSFRAEFSGNKGCIMLPNKIQLGFNTENLPRNVTGEYVVQREFDTNLLNDKDARRSFILDVTKEILYSFNMSYFDEQKLIDFISQADKQV